MIKIEKQRKQKDNGITLIALVITIIVLLILAGVTISTLTGENGILTRASDAKTETEISSAKEQAQLDISNWVADRLENGEDATLNNSIIKEILTGKEYVKGEPGDTSFISKDGEHEIMYSDLYESNIKEYTEDGVPIPKGFYYVGGTKDTGVVISDMQGDDLNNTKQGNQFVWVPVDKFDEFKRYDFQNDTEVSNSCTEATSDGTKDQTEVDKMYKSVKENGGFYVGRYEAGTTAEDGGSGIRGALVCKKGANIYYKIKWGNSLTDETDGAVQLARSMYSKENGDSVTSTLIYGIQWDAIMRWMKDEPNLTGGKYVKDSTDMGWYYNNSGNTDHKAGTDINENKSNCVKNIYDLGGNVAEWTMESYNGIAITVRGGRFNSSSSANPASSRFYCMPSDESNMILGFRVTLYL